MTKGKEKETKQSENGRIVCKKKLCRSRKCQVHAVHMGLQIFCDLMHGSNNEGKGTG